MKLAIAVAILFVIAVLFFSNEKELGSQTYIDNVTVDKADAGITFVIYNLGIENYTLVSINETICSIAKDFIGKTVVAEISVTRVRDFRGKEYYRYELISINPQPVFFFAALFFLLNRVV